MTRWRIRAVLAAAALGVGFGSMSAAQADQLQFTITWTDGSVESFDVDTAQVGLVSQAGVGFTGSQSAIDLAITADTLGNTTLVVSEAADSGYLGTGLSDAAAYFSPDTGDYFAPTVFYDGINPMLAAFAGETANGDKQSTLSVAAVSSAPEPATWALMMAGVVVAGLVYRRRGHGGLSFARRSTPRYRSPR